MHYWIPLEKCFVFKKHISLILAMIIKAILYHHVLFGSKRMCFLKYLFIYRQSCITKTQIVLSPSTPLPPNVLHLCSHIKHSSSFKKLVWEKPYWKCMDCCGYTDVVIPHKLAVVQFMDFCKRHAGSHKTAVQYITSAV